MASSSFLWSFGLTDLAKYPLNLESGQRKLGPPADWTGPPPPKGAEIFVGHLPRDILEHQLVRLFSFAGNIYQIRLMMEHRSANLYAPLTLVKSFKLFFIFLLTATIDPLTLALASIVAVALILSSYFNQTYSPISLPLQ